MSLVRYITMLLAGYTLLNKTSTVNGDCGPIIPYSQNLDIHFFSTWMVSIYPSWSSFITYFVKDSKIHFSRGMENPLRYKLSPSKVYLAVLRSQLHSTFKGLFPILRKCIIGVLLSFMFSTLIHSFTFINGVESSL